MYHPYPDERARAIGLAQKYIHSDPLFLDTETTGLEERDEICEIAVINVQGNVLINSLVKPTVPIGGNASQIHGITNAMVADAPTFAALLPELEHALRGRTVLVWNKDFDMGKIARSALTNNCPFQDGEAWYWMQPTGEVTPRGAENYASPWHCAMKLYSMFYGDWSDYHQSYRWQRLGNAALQCGIDLPLGIHHALNDAELTRRIVLYMAGVSAAEKADDESGGGKRSMKLLTGTQLQLPLSLFDQEDKDEPTK